MRDAKSWSRKHHVACLLIGLVGVAGAWCGCARNPQAIATHRELLRELEEDSGETAARPDPRPRRSRLTAKIGTTRPENPSDDPFLREEEEVARAETASRAGPSKSSDDKTAAAQEGKLQVAGAERSVPSPPTPRAPARETLSPARLKADTLMFRARSALSQDRFAEAIRLAREAQRIEQSERLEYRPGEERPSQFLARVERIVAGQDTLDDVAAAAGPAVSAVEEVADRLAESQVMELPPAGGDEEVDAPQDESDTPPQRQQNVKNDDVPYIEDVATGEAAFPGAEVHDEMAAETAQDNSKEGLAEDGTSDIDERDGESAVVPEVIAAPPVLTPPILTAPDAPRPAGPPGAKSEPKGERKFDDKAEPRAKSTSPRNTSTAQSQEQGPALGSAQALAPAPDSAAGSTSKAANRAVPMQLPRNQPEAVAEKLAPAPHDRVNVERPPRRGPAEHAPLPHGKAGVTSEAAPPAGRNPLRPLQPYSTREPLRPLPAAPPIPPEAREMSPIPPSSPHSTSPGVGSPANPSRLERRALDSRAVASDGHGEKIAEVAVNAPRSLAGPASLSPVTSASVSELPAISAAPSVKTQTPDNEVAGSSVAQKDDPSLPRREAGIVITPGPVANTSESAPPVARKGKEKPSARRVKHVSTDEARGGTEPDTDSAAEAPVNDEEVSESDSDDEQSRPRTLQSLPQVADTQAEPEPNAQASVTVSLSLGIESPAETPWFAGETPILGDQLALANQAARVPGPALAGEVAAPLLTPPSAEREEAAPAPPTEPLPVTTTKSAAPIASKAVSTTAVDAQSVEEEDPQVRRPRWTRLSQLGLIVGLCGLFGLGLFRRMERSEFQARRNLRDGDSTE